MHCNICQKIIILFILTFSFGGFVINGFGQKRQKDKNKIVPCDLSARGGGLSEQITGIAADYDYSATEKLVKNKPKKYTVGTKPLKIISKPRAYYTDEAKQNCIQGRVLLRITFLANATIGKIKVLEGLDYGLTDKAIEAAKLIKFEPEIKKNKAININKKVTYNFFIY